MSVKTSCHWGARVQACLLALRATCFPEGGEESAPGEGGVKSAFCGRRLWRTGLPAFFLFAAAACMPLLQSSTTAPPERFDLGLGRVETAAPARPIPFTLRAMPTLDSALIRYRLSYADPTKVMEYARSRWAGTPTEILEQYLKRHLDQAEAHGQTTQHCRFDLELLRFEQVFSSVGESHAVISMRVRLQNPGVGTLDERNLELTAPAPTPDASGGVKALAQAAGQLVQALRQQFAAHGCNP